MNINTTTHAKVYISTNGCVEAQLSSKCVEKYFEMNKLTITTNVKEADFIVFYACGLTEQKEKDSLQIIKNLKTKMNYTAKLIVWGCLSKQNPKSLATIYNGPPIGPLDIDFFKEALGKNAVSFDDIAIAASAEELNSREISGQYNKNRDDLITNTILLSKEVYNKLCDKIQKKTKPYYIRVATGCTGYCTYCSERPVFGGIKSRPVEDVISEFKQGLQQGYNRISLLATDLGAYGRDMNSNLCDLLRKIIEINSNINYQIILNQVEPKNLIEIFPDLEEILGSGKVEELMCPVQSGSNRILKIMGRRYTIEDWKSCMLKINKEFPNIRLSTHFMVGFPTETEEDFNATLELLDPPIYFDDITIFNFSTRPTVSAKNISGQISETTKELRRKELQRKYARMCVYNITRFHGRL